MKMTAFRAFRARERLELSINDWNSNDSGRIVLEAGTHFTREKALLKHLEERWGEAVEIAPKQQQFPGAAPVSRWPQLRNFRGRVLIVCPTRAIGDNVMILCALSALLDANPHLELGIAFVAHAHAISRWEPRLKVHPYVVSEDDFKEYQGLIDLFHLEEMHDHVYKAFDLEGRLLAAFDIPPSRRFGGPGQPPKDPSRPKIGMFPLASDPLRTIPPEATRAIARAAAAFGPVTIVLNPHQVDAKPYADAVEGDLPDNVTISTDEMGSEDFIDVVAGFDYGIFTDSGPCHIAKLHQTQGFAVFTTVPAAVRVGRYENFRVWQTKFRGRHCTAPCGLATLLITPSGKRGCWETLGPDEGRYHYSKEVGDRDEYLAFTFERPVPCVASNRDRAETLARAVSNDIRSRLLGARALAADAETGS